MSIIRELTNGRKGGEPLFTDHRGGPLSPDARILRRCRCNGLLCSTALPGRKIGRANVSLLGYSQPSNVVRNVTVEETAIKTLE